MYPVGSVQDKPALRAAVLATRARAGAGERAVADASRTAALLAAFRDAPELRFPGCVTSYLSVGSEPNTSDLLAGLATAGVRVLLPRLRVDGGLDLVDADADDGARAPGLRGIPVPVGPAVDPRVADVWVVPALAVDLHGTRLGRGGGAYDRVLPAGVPTIALLHLGELVTELPAEAHDRPVSHVALPTGVRRL
jgi:5-formyltetrahydrofolate cyclo-ligase